MNDPGAYSRFPVHHLDPSAQEFFPAAVGAPVFYPYPPPLLPIYDNIGFPSPPPFLEPPPQQHHLPVSLPPASPSPSRALLLSMVPSTVSESTLRRELEIFGDVRAVEMERRREGLVTVHFYDVRDAQAALMAIQEQHMQQQFRLGRHYEAVMNNSMGFITVPPPLLPPQTAAGLISGSVVWAQFIAPVTFGLPDGNNQGTLVIFNLDPGISASHLKDIFEAFGPVKELRETPNKRNQKFVEFHDVRNAAKAMSEMNGKEIAGKPLVIEFSRPGGQCKKYWKGHGGGGPSRMSSSPPPQPPRSRNLFRLFPPQKKSPHWKTAARGGRSKSSSSESSLSGSVSKLCLSSSSGYYEDCSSSRPTTTRKNVSKKSGGSTSKHSPHGGGGRPWKGGGRQGKEHDPSFLINEDAIMETNCSDPRTTIMIKNIPNKYSQKLLLNMLDNHCIHCNEQLAGGDDQPLSSYDFVYLPIDFINKCNVGYGFVNMTSPQATLRLYKAFHHQNWEVFNSRKICEVTYARLQGLDALREHFKNSKFPSDAEEYMPVLFSPARDGRILSDPVPIVGRSRVRNSAENPRPPECDGVEDINENEMEEERAAEAFSSTDGDGMGVY